MLKPRRYAGSRCPNCDVSLTNVQGVAACPECDYVEPTDDRSASR